MLSMRDGKLSFEHVRRIIAGIGGVSLDGVTADTSLRLLGFTSSLPLLKLQSALEARAGRALPLLADSMTVGEVLTAGEVPTATGSPIVDEEIPTRLPKPTLRSRPPDLGAESFFIGVDIEEFSQFPKASDPAKDDFYSAQFTEEEIAYALLSANPVATFCGLFCAKESVKKSAPDLLNLRMREIQIHHRDGRPEVVLVDRSLSHRYRFTLGVSHSTNYAVATVLAIRI
ncbi:MAG: 4'-phosphopantetheinyl transferase superfamily protein [Acidobacteria bacterium]|nr:4'-phosphopantetheinyl transferase superfamily protein [Acidobacteriota bacterium]